MADTWRFHNPVEITFGPGKLKNLAGLIGGRSYALVTYDEALFRDLGTRIADLAGQPAVIIDWVTPNPHFDALAEICGRFGAFVPSPEIIVALGGGSVIDVAKVLAAARGDFSSIRHYLETGKGGETLGETPIIAIPTTSGTGSEVTRWATVWDIDGGRKHSLDRPKLFPEHALVDPELMLQLPRSLTVSTGLDALSHALESLWNRNANPVSSSLAVGAAREILDVLPRLAEDLENLELRTRMAWSAVAAGLAFSNTATSLAHSISYPITLQKGVVHGIACSFSLPLVMRAVTGEDEACDSALKQIFGSNLRQGARALSQFLARLGVSDDPADYGLDAAGWREVIDLAFAGERGQNFIGRQGKFMAEAKA